MFLKPGVGITQSHPIKVNRKINIII